MNEYAAGGDGRTNEHTVSIARFRSTFAHGRGTLTAELHPEPGHHWLELCRMSLERFAEGFERVPQLLDATIVIPVLAHELATAEMALHTLVRVTNELYAESAGA